MHRLAAWLALCLIADTLHAKTALRVMSYNIWAGSGYEEKGIEEPSHLDWTPAAVAAGQHAVGVKWPTTKRLTDQGFVDAYRAAHADPVAKSAFTWTARYEQSETDDHPDRIDFVFSKGTNLKVVDAAIVGEDGPRSDITVMLWSSDQRAIVAEVTFLSTAPAG